MNNILITGANGFLGQHLFLKLSEVNSMDRIFLLSRSPSTEYFSEYIENKILDRDNHNVKVENVQGNMEDFDNLRRIIADKEITQIYHLASKAIVRTCANDPMTAYMTNVMGTVNLLEAVRQVGMNNVKSIVISTSDKAYGHTEPPYTSASPLFPKYTYEATKACQDIVAQNYYYNYKLPIKIVRASNIYGPGDPNTSRIIPSTCIKFKRGQKATVFSGTMNYRREFLYIDDVVDAFIKVMNHAENELSPFIYPLGGTMPVTVLDIVNMLGMIANKGKDAIEIVEKPPLFKEIEAQYVEDGNMKNIGWTPKTTLIDGLKFTYDSYC